MSETNSSLIPCPVCDRQFSKESVEDHVNKCLFLNTDGTSKRNGSHLSSISPQEKRIRTGYDSTAKRNWSTMTGSTKKDILLSHSTTEASSSLSSNKSNEKICYETVTKTIPLAEQMRPKNLTDIVGQNGSFGSGSMLRSLLEQKKIPNMILWGPPGCGKTSLANVVAAMCKEQNNLRFVKLSATMAGINDVKEVVKVAKNEAQYKRQTILFMDEIHRFNKLQQDTFLPHVENGTIILIGATTENPSFSLNNALLSRCRVVVLEKLSSDDVVLILERALAKKQAMVVDADGPTKKCETEEDIPKCIIERASLRWLADVCDGDARVALGALELALEARDPGPDLAATGPAILSLKDIQNGIKRTHMLYDRGGEEHYNIISAVQKSIRASDDNAALYWTTRALHSGEDPLYVARRLVRTACEDIGIADPNALVEAVACLQGCQHIGMPECDILLAQCAVRLARAPKTHEVYHAMKRCQTSLTDAKGPLPSVPLHLRNAPTKLMKQLGYGQGYNTKHRDQSGLSYMPEGMEDVKFFERSDDDNT